MADRFQAFKKNADSYAVTDTYKGEIVWTVYTIPDGEVAAKQESNALATLLNVVYLLGRHAGLETAQNILSNE